MAYIFGLFSFLFSTFSLQTLDHVIGFQEKRQSFRRKLAKIAQNMIPTSTPVADNCFGATDCDLCNSET
jgi:hypothetical protein